jgi:hypothetical protein
METKPKDQNAFPSGEYGGGMSLRDYFAAKVMQNIFTTGTLYSDKEIAEISYKMADAMLKQREK